MFVVLTSGAALEGSGGGNGMMDAFKTNPTFLSINLVVSAIVIAMNRISSRSSL